MSMTAGNQPVSNEALGAFFNEVSEQYDTTIFRTVPPYREMFDALLGYSFLDAARPLHILELGCGTGNLTLLLADQFPQAHVTFVDLSEDMLAQTARKLEPRTKNYTPIQGGFLEMDLPSGEFDFITSSIALHHVEDVDKPILYQKIHRWLKPGGKFRCADQVLTLPVHQGHEKDWRDWQAWSLQVGATEEDLKMWQAHGEAFDHYAPLRDHFEWLAAAGFAEVDCYWKKLWWCVFGGEKLLR